MSEREMKIIKGMRDSDCERPRERDRRAREHLRKSMRIRDSIGEIK